MKRGRTIQSDCYKKKMFFLLAGPSIDLKMSYQVGAHVKRHV